MEFEPLLRQHETRVLRLALRLTGNLADAQDSAQEVFLRLHHHLHELPSHEMVPAWLHRVTVNICLDLARRSRKTVPVEGLTLVSRTRTPERQSMDQQASDRLQAALSQLGERERAVLVLRELEGVPTAEVAEIMGTTESTVRVQIAKARLKLRELLKEVRV